MSTSLAQTKGLDAHWPREADESLGRVQILSTSTDTVSGQIESYPYNGQRKIYGKFSYKLDGWMEEDVTRGGEYEYRVRSGLFMLNTDTDHPKSQSVIDELNKQFEDSVQIEEILIDRESLMDFFDESDQILGIDTMGESGQIRHYSVDEVDTQTEVIQSADISFKFNSEQVVVHYNRGRMQIPRVSEEGREYVIQLFEKHVLPK